MGSSCKRDLKQGSLVRTTISNRTGFELVYCQSEGRKTERNSYRTRKLPSSKTLGMKQHKN